MGTQRGKKNEKIRLERKRLNDQERRPDYQEKVEEKKWLKVERRMMWRVCVLTLGRV